MKNNKFLLSLVILILGTCDLYSSEPAIDILEIRDFQEGKKFLWSVQKDVLEQHSVWTDVEKLIRIQPKALERVYSTVPSVKRLNLVSIEIRRSIKKGQEKYGCFVMTFKKSLEDDSFGTTIVVLLDGEILVQPKTTDLGQPSM